MKIKTELSMMDNNEIRIVDCPSDNPSLDEVYYYGQNDFQPQNKCSLSIGDLIHLNNKVYVIKSLGFQELLDPENYKLLNYREKMYMLYDKTVV